MNSISIDVLGVGGGATSVYCGDASSSFVLPIDNWKLLLDAGYGCAKSCLQYIGSIPSHIFISHNHSDHSGELPVILAVESHRKLLMTVYAHGQVLQRLLNHRLHELFSVADAQEDVPEDRIAREARDTTTTSCLSRFARFISLDDEIPYTVYPEGHVTITPVQSRHSEICYGLVISVHAEPILGWTADSGRDQILENRMAMCDTILVDARLNGSREHMSFADVEHLATSTWKGKKIYVYGYGTKEDLGSFSFTSNVSIISPGDKIQIKSVTITKEHMNLPNDLKVKKTFENHN